MTPQEQPDSQDRADELANLIKSELPMDSQDGDSPAEALRQQIDSLRAKYYLRCIELQSYDSFSALASNAEHFMDAIMELVTAYAATVEREAELKGRVDELKHLDSLTYSFMSLGNDFDYSYRQSAVDARLAALQGPQDTTQ